MSIYGQTEVAYYQLTEVGWQRAQNPAQTRGLDVATIGILREFASHGGTMEWDEILFLGTVDSPTIASTALRRLVDLGYVTPVQAQPEAV